MCCNCYQYVKTILRRNVGKKDKSKDCTALYKCYTHRYHQFILPSCSFQKSLKIVALICINCWRALARQHPILYNSEKKAKSVGCKIEDMRSRMCFYIRAFRGAGECTWKYRSISSNSPAQLEIKDTINEVKYGCL